MGKKQNLIIGAAANYNFNQLKPWILSACESTDASVQIVLITKNLTQETIDSIKNCSVKVIEMPDMGNIPIHVARFLAIYNYLKDNHVKYDQVITTDVKDVVFQSNPFNFIEQTYEEDYVSLFVGSEGMFYKDEPWGNENLMQTFGPYFYEQFKDNLIYNVGVFGGDVEYVKDMCLSIFLGAMGKPIPIVDQSVFNVLVQTQPWKSQTCFTVQRHGWVCHAGTTADPSKMHLFRPLLQEPEPIFEDGVVKTCDGVNFSIVHQYDRWPEVFEFVKKKYNQTLEFSGSLFKYTTT